MGFALIMVSVGWAVYMAHITVSKTRKPTHMPSCREKTETVSSVLEGHGTMPPISQERERKERDYKNEKYIVKPLIILRSCYF